MVKQNEHSPGRGGSIITMSSVNAVMAIPTCAGYNASKGGLSNLTRYRISPWRRCWEDEKPKKGLCCHAAALQWGRSHHHCDCCEDGLPC